MPLTHKEDRVETIKYLSDLNEYHKTTPFSVLQENYVEQLRAVLNYSPRLELLEAPVVPPDREEGKVSIGATTHEITNISQTDEGVIKSIDFDGVTFIRKDQIPTATVSTPPTQDTKCNGGLDDIMVVEATGLVLSGEARLVVNTGGSPQPNKIYATNAGQDSGVWLRAEVDLTEHSAGLVSFELEKDAYIGHLEVQAYFSKDRAVAISFSVAYSEEDGSVKEQCDIFGFAMTDLERALAILPRNVYNGSEYNTSGGVSLGIHPKRLKELKEIDEENRKRK